MCQTNLSIKLCIIERSNISIKRTQDIYEPIKILFDEVRLL